MLGQPKKESCEVGRCLNNEDPIHQGRATDAFLYLNFRGMGVTIIYRQDIWYGSLAVEIDREGVGFINQKGQIKNQSERSFRAGSMGQHFLVLRGSEAKGAINIDAIRILNDEGIRMILVRSSHKLV